MTILTHVYRNVILDRLFTFTGDYIRSYYTATISIISSILERIIYRYLRLILMHNIPIHVILLGFSLRCSHVRQSLYRCQHPATANTSSFSLRYTENVRKPLH